MAGRGVYDNNIRQNDTYNSIRDQLERETHALIQERSGIQVHRPSVTQVPYSRNRVESANYSPGGNWRAEPAPPQRKQTFQV